MAKIKKEVETLDDWILDTGFEKKYKDVLLDGDWLINEDKKIFSVSPAIDIGLGGGVPEGSWVILSGKEKAGKTLTGLHLMANYQREGRLCFYINIEGRLKRRDLQGINGLDASKVKIVTSTEGNILSGEDFANIISNIIRAHPRCYILMDSASALCSSKELTEEITATGRVLGPRILAAFCRQNGTVVPIQKTTLVMVQHLIANTSGYGASQYEDGGRKVKYQGDIHMRCSTFDKWVDKDGNQIGQIPTWEVKYSALGSPGMKVQSYIRYGTGIDEVMELINLGTDLGLLSKGGSWFTLDFLEEPIKLQGEANVYDYLANENTSLVVLRNKIKELVG